MYNKDLTQDDYSSIRENYFSYIKNHDLPHEVSAYIELLYDVNYRHIELKKNDEKAFNELSEEYIKLGKEHKKKCSEFTEEYGKTLSAITEFMALLSKYLKIDRNELMQMFLTEQHKAGNGGRAVRKYEDYEAEIKLALDKHLDAPNHTPFTLDGVAAQIGNAVEEKIGIYKEPAPSQVSAWKKTYKETNRKSIYA